MARTAPVLHWSSKVYGGLSAGELIPHLVQILVRLDDDLSGLPSSMFLPWEQGPSMMSTPLGRSCTYETAGWPISAAI